MYLYHARKLEAITGRCDAIRCPGLHAHYTDARTSLQSCLKWTVIILNVGINRCNY